MTKTDSLARYRELLAAELKAARLAANLTQAQLGEKLGSDQCSVSSVEHARQNVSLKRIWQWARACRKRPISILWWAANYLR